MRGRGGDTYNLDGRIYVRLFATFAPRQLALMMFQMLFPEFLFFIFRNDVSAEGFTP